MAENKTKRGGKSSPPSSDKNEEKCAFLHILLAGTLFAVQRDQVLDITGEETICHLPLTPPFFKGLTHLNGVTSYVFNLANLVGLKTGTSSSEGVLLVASRDKPGSAFSIDSIEEEETVSSDNILPLPPYLKSKYIESGVIKGESLIPLINLKRIYKDVHSQDWQAVTPALTLAPGKPEKKKKEAGKVRLFTLGGDSFAAEGIDPPASVFTPKRISPLPGTPDFVQGITLFQDKVLTVINTTSRIGKEAKEGEKTLIAKIDDYFFGFLIEKDKGTKLIREDERRDIPPVAKKEWLSEAFLRGKEIIPLLQLDKLLILEAEEENEEQLAESYAPDFSFDSLFLQRDVNISEFLLMGNRYALPASEAKEILSLRSYRNFPSLPSIIAGIAEHDGRLLPVLDIGLCFGYRSQSGKKQKMILLENGDFRALVLAEALYEKKVLPVDMQRRIPVIMKHRFLYGCYPENKEKQARLILNIYKLTLYFDEGMVKELFNAALGDIEEKPLEATGREDSPDGSAMVGEPQRDEPLPAREESRTGGTQTGDAADLDGEKEEGISNIEAYGDQKEPSEISFQATGADAATIDTGSDQKMNEEYPGLPEETVEAESGEEHEAVAPAAAFATDAALTGEERPVEISSSTEGNDTGEIDTGRDQGMDEEHPGLPEESCEQETLEAESDDENEAAVPEKAFTTYGQPGETGETLPGISFSATSSDSYAAETTPYAEKKERKESNNNAWILIIIILLLTGGTLTYFILPKSRDSLKISASETGQQTAASVPTGTLEKPVPIESTHDDEVRESTEKAPHMGKDSTTTVPHLPEIEGKRIAKENGIDDVPVQKAFLETPAPVVEVFKEPEQVIIKEVKEVPQKKWKRNKKKKYPPLGEFDFYTVEGGDTLWDIADAYSKNPFDYYLVAEDNKIVDPDLIYPGQKLRLQKKWKESDD